MIAGAGLCDPEAVGVLVREGPARVRELALLGANFDPGDDADSWRLAREGATVAEAAGVELDDAPLDFPLCRIVSAEDAEAVELVRNEGRRMEEAGMTSIRVSMLQSVERGRLTEVEAVHGFLVREAARFDVPVPTTELFYRLLEAIDRSGE